MEILKQPVGFDEQISNIVNAVPGVYPFLISMDWGGAIGLQSKVIRGGKETGVVVGWERRLFDNDGAEFIWIWAETARPDWLAVVSSEPSMFIDTDRKGWQKRFMLDLKGACENPGFYLDPSGNPAEKRYLYLPPVQLSLVKNKKKESNSLKSPSSLPNLFLLK